MNSSRHANPKKAAVRIVVALMMAMFFSSCSATSPENVNPAPNPNWVRVRSNPPTWYPRGTPANFATSHRDGEWIYTEDSNGTCFFIPLHGLSPERRKALLAEAFAARNPAKVRRINQEEMDRLIATGVLGVIVAPIISLGNAGI